MKKARKSSAFVLLMVVMIMALICLITMTAAKLLSGDDANVTGLHKRYNFTWDTAKQKDIIILQNSGNSKNEAKQTIIATEETEYLPKSATPSFMLPASLQSIEDEAFEGTALVNVEIPEKVEYIGERAFSNIPTLRNVRIPEQTTSIAKTAFAGSNHVMITGAPGSYARKYAAENGIPFGPLTVMYANAGPGNGVSLNRNRVPKEILDDEEEPGKKENKPTGRIVGEIKAQSCLNSVAYHITGRAPPVDA